MFKPSYDASIRPGAGHLGVVAVVGGVVVQFAEAFAVVQQGGEVAVEAQEAVAGGFGGFAQEDDVGAVDEAAQQVEAVLAFALGGDDQLIELFGRQSSDGGIGLGGALALQ